METRRAMAAILGSERIRRGRGLRAGLGGFVLALLAYGSLGAFVVQAEPKASCDALALKRAVKQDGYRWHPDRQTCEGFFDKPRRVELSLVGVTLGLSIPKPEEDEEVELRLPGGSSLEKKTIHLQVFAPWVMVDKKSLAYRMDKDLPAMGRHSWKPAEYLDREDLTSGVGLVAWVDEGPERVYVPVAIRVNAGTVPWGDPEGELFMSVRVPGYAEWVKACVQPLIPLDLSVPEMELPLCNWFTVDRGTRAGTQAYVPIPRSPAGKVRVSIEARVAGRDYPLSATILLPEAW